MTQQEDELQRKAEQLARQCDREGFIVTSRGEVEAAGVAWLIDSNVDRMRKWRDTGLGPAPSRTVRRVAFYDCIEIARWIERSMCARRTVLPGDAGSGAECDAGG